MAIDRTGISSLQTGAPEIKYTGTEGPRSPDQQMMAMADPMLVEEYNKYVFEMEEQGLQPVSFKEFVQQIMSGMAYGGTARPTYTQSRKQRINAAGGGIMGSNAGSMLVAPTADGSRPGYGWLGDAWESVKNIAAPVIDWGKDLFSGAPDVSNLPPSMRGGATDALWTPDVVNQLGKIAGPVQGILESIPQAKIAGPVQGILKSIPQTPGNIIPELVKQATQKYSTTGTGDTEFGQDVWTQDDDTILPKPKPPKESEFDWTKPSTYPAAIGRFLGGDQPYLGPGGKMVYPVNWRGPLTMGLGIGALDAATRKKDMLPQDTSAIDMAAAIRGDDLRFRPDPSVLQSAEGGIARLAQGGRIGYQYAGPVNMRMASHPVNDQILENLYEEHYDRLKGLGHNDDKIHEIIMDMFYNLPGAEGRAPVEETGIMQAAKGGRIGYDNGGLSSLDFVDKIYSDEARALAGNIPEILKHDSQYAPTLLEEQIDTGEWGRSGAPREGQEYLTSTLQDANTELDRMETQKQQLKEIAAEKGLNFNDIFQMELAKRIKELGPATKKITEIDDRKRLLNLIEEKLQGGEYAQGGTFKSRTPIGKKKLSSYAQGGRIGYRNGSGPYQDYLQDLKDGLISSDTTFNEWLDDNAPDPDHDLIYAQGGRIGYQGGGDYETQVQQLMDQGLSRPMAEFLASQGISTELKAQGGRIRAQEGGLMDLGGMEKDYREEGGFVPIGGQERADDVPARLSKNEFVFTADAVRAAGGGDIDKGAEVMENVMDNLERGGQVSEESQGLEGARNMFATAQRLEGVL